MPPKKKPPKKPKPTEEDQDNGDEEPVQPKPQPQPKPTKPEEPTTIEIGGASATNVNPLIALGTAGGLAAAGAIGRYAGPYIAQKFAQRYGINLNEFEIPGVRFRQGRHGFSTRPIVERFTGGGLTNKKETKRERQQRQQLEQEEDEILFQNQSEENLFRGVPEFEPFGKRFSVNGLLTPGKNITETDLGNFRKSLRRVQKGSKIKQILGEEAVVGNERTIEYNAPTRRPSIIGNRFFQNREFKELLRGQIINPEEGVPTAEPNPNPTEQVRQPAVKFDVGAQVRPTLKSPRASITAIDELEPIKKATVKFDLASQIKPTATEPLPPPTVENIDTAMSIPWTTEPAPVKNVLTTAQVVPTERPPVIPIVQPPPAPIVAETPKPQVADIPIEPPLQAVNLQPQITSTQQAPKEPIKVPRKPISYNGPGTAGEKPAKAVGMQGIRKAPQKPSPFEKLVKGLTAQKEAQRTTATEQAAPMETETVVRNPITSVSTIIKRPTEARPSFMEEENAGYPNKRIKTTQPIVEEPLLFVE